MTATSLYPDMAFPATTMEESPPPFGLSVQGKVGEASSPKECDSTAPTGKGTRLTWSAKL